MNRTGSVVCCYAPCKNERSPVRANPVLRHLHERVVSLDGGWRFRLDPEDEGVKLEWFDKPRGFTDAVEVPGCWQGQGFGGDGKDTVWDFQIAARTLRATYRGTAWYYKRFRPPKEWQGLRVWVNFGGVHPSAEVWLNGQLLGSHSGPFVPFALDVTELLSFGRDNSLVVRVHERDRWMGFAYNFQGHWSGLFRSVELSATGKCWLERFWVHPDVEGQRLRFRVALGGFDKPVKLVISAGPCGGDPTARTMQMLKRRETEFSLSVPSPKLWSPDEPNLYRVDAVLRQGEEVVDAVSERVGFVKLSTEGKHFLINGEPYYLRGLGDFVTNPETASPDTNRDRWRRKLKVVRDYGYNYVRCQSYVPVPEYYDVADEVGLLVQGEMGMLGAWGGMSPWHPYAYPPPRPEFRRALKWQWDQTVMRDVNHPSANLYCMSNELGVSTLYPRTAWECYHDTKEIKPSAFVIWTDGGHSQDLPGDFINAEAGVDKDYELPVIQHEFRWWGGYPDVRLRGKYEGAVRPYVIEIAEEAASRSGMSRLLPTMARNAQRLQYLESRAKLEICRRDNPTLAGISHFTFCDCGLAVQGTVDDFYNQKYTDADLWRRTMGDTVILIEHNLDDRVLVGGQTLQSGFFVSDFSHPPLKQPVLEWELVAGRRRLGQGAVKFRHHAFCTCPAGRMQLPLPEVSRTLPLTLRATLHEGARSFCNEWSFWLFPRQAELPSCFAVYGIPNHTWLASWKGAPRVSSADLGMWARQARGSGAGQATRLGAEPSSPAVVLAEVLDDPLAHYARLGGRVILCASEGLVRPFPPKLGLSVGRYFFMPPANYPPLEDGHTGTIIAHHPMLRNLPHEGFADLQFYRLIAEAPPLDLEPLNLRGAEPVFRALSTYFVCRPLAYLVEFGLGKGGLIVSALNLDQKLPEARYLLASMLKYAASAEFRPKAKLGEGALKWLQEMTDLP